MGSPKRREIGHGALAERALLPVIPSEEEYEDEKPLRRESFEKFMQLETRELISDEGLFSELKRYYGLFLKINVGKKVADCLCTHTTLEVDAIVALDMKLYARDEIDRLNELIRDLLETLLATMRQHIDTFMPVGTKATAAWISRPSSRRSIRRCSADASSSTALRPRRIRAPCAWAFPVRFRCPTMRLS